MTLVQTLQQRAERAAVDHDRGTIPIIISYLSDVTTLGEGTRGRGRAINHVAIEHAIDSGAALTHAAGARAEIVRRFVRMLTRIVAGMRPKKRRYFQASHSRAS
jgi:hypothetical protein